MYFVFSCYKEGLIRLDSKEKEIWIVSRTPKKIESETKEKITKSTPANVRELALATIANRLGESQSWDQKANNAFVYYSLPTFTSFGMAFEKRMNQLIGNINATITECSCDKCQKGQMKDCSLFGRSIIIEGGIFENTNTLTEWFMNFFQQSPSINGLARENQVEIAKAGYATATVPVWTPFGKEERAPKAGE